jgi:hypothetical protein
MKEFQDRKEKQTCLNSVVRKLLMLMITHILTHNIILIHHYTVATKLLFSQMHTNCSRVQVQPLIAFFVAQNKQLSVPS